MDLWLLASFPESKPHFSFVANAAANELMKLRWLHFIFGIIWIGLLYFFNLVGTPSMKALEPGVRVKVYPVLMSRAMAWFRWSALVTVIAGMRYFFSLLETDADDWDRRECDCGFLDGAGAEWRGECVEPTFSDQCRRRTWLRYAAEHLGRGLAGAEAIDCVGARGGGAGDADAGGGGAHDALGISYRADFVVAFVSDAVFYGGS